MNRIPSTVKTMALAVALALPAAPTFAASMSDIVTTRDDQDVHQQFGRDSVYAMETRQPVQTESHVSSDSGIGKVFAGVGAAGTSAWHKMTSLFEPRSETSQTVVAQQPQWYGRSGGYVGIDQLALLERAGPATDVSQPVTAGEAMAIAPAERDVRYPAASESQLYDRSENRFSQATETTPAASSEPVTSEQPVVANDVQAPAATEIQPYGREDQPYGRNEDQLSESAGPAPAAVPSEPTEQRSAANDATMFGRDQDEVYDSAAATGNGSQSPDGSKPQIATNQSAAPGEEELSGRNDELLPEASQGAGNDQAAIAQEGAGEAAQSAPSPDSVTVLDEEKSRLGRAARGTSIGVRA